MVSAFKPKVRFTSNEEIYHFTAAGKLEKTTVYIAPICPFCRRSEHNFEFDNVTVWCCANDSCMESRLDSAGSQARIYPINFIGHLRRRNQFASASLLRDGITDDFVDKWELLKQGKIKDIILQGDLGIGKTASMYAALREVCKLSPQSTSLFLTETELYEKIKNSWEKESRLTEQEVMKRFSNADFLFIDDLGSATKSNQGDWSKQVLLDILDERLNSLTNRTIISSNFVIETVINDIENKANKDPSLAEIYGSRIADRLRMMTKSYMQGKSRRSPPNEKEIAGTSQIAPTLT